MERKSWISIFSVLVLFLSSFSLCFGSENSEIVFSDEIRTAFYERSPNSFSILMSQAVSNSCASTKIAIPENLKSWLCINKKLNYFRSVYVNGNKGAHGLICESSGTDFFKYFGVDQVDEVLTDGSCVKAEFDGKKYELRIEEYTNEKNT